jgi:hypothetical protein
MEGTGGEDFVWGGADEGVAADCFGGGGGFEEEGEFGFGAGGYASVC